MLRRDATLWLNLGDSYGGSWGNSHPYSPPVKHGHRSRFTAGDQSFLPPTAGAPGLKPKDLAGVPWRVALALQADGWYLRSDVIWAKPNPMPESVRDRPTRAHEYLFLLARSQRYFWDQEAVREPWVGGRPHRPEGAAGQRAGRNLRTVWNIPAEPFPSAHFATFPPRLVEPCIRASTSQRGCCRRCGSPWVRLPGKAQRVPGRGSGNRERRIARLGERGRLNTHLGSSVPWEPTATPTVGWRPACGCDAGDAVPCTVLDPFGGAGTTALAARQLGRHSGYIDRNRSYADMAVRRLLGQPMRPKAA